MQIMKKALILYSFAFCMFCASRPVYATEPDSLLTIVFAGDLMQHLPQVNSARTEDGFDYAECFRFIKHQIEYADIAVGNFETTLAGEPYSGFPAFSSPDAFLEGVRDCGFDVLLTANNHICDKGSAGLLRTIQKMDALGLSHLGAYRDSLEREQRYPLIVEKKGLRIAFLNYTYGTNGHVAEPPCVVNYTRQEQMLIDIEKAKNLQADVIIACMHWGNEYQTEPTKGQRALASWLLKQGVDHVIGSHPHVMQPLKLINGKHVVAYSLGNFVSNQRAPLTYGGMLVHITLEKDTSQQTDISNEVSLTDCRYSLSFVSRPAVSGRKSHRVYDVSTPDASLRRAERLLRDTFLKDLDSLSLRPQIICK